jgi:hypothetical protein
MNKRIATARSLIAFLSISIGVAQQPAPVNYYRWGYTRVVTPTGSAEEHDLIGFYAYEKWEQLEPEEKTPDGVIAAMKALGFASGEDYAAKRNALRDVVLARSGRSRPALL